MTEPPVSPQTSINNAAREQPRRGGGPAQWADDFSPIAASDWSFDRAAHLLERAGFGGTPEEIARLAAMTPASGRRRPGRLSLDRQRPPRAVRALRRLGPEPARLPGEPRGRDRARAKDRRGDGRAHQARGRAPPAAGGRSLLLLAARHRARDPSPGALVGRPHGRDQPAAAREDGAVLARPFRDRRGEDPRLSQDGAAARAVPSPCDRQFPRASRSMSRAIRRCSPTSTRRRT